MFTICEGCLERTSNDCPLYVFITEDGFIFMSCIIFGLVEMGASILGKVDTGGDGEMPDL